MRVAACTSWAYRMCDGRNQAMICGVVDKIVPDLNNANYYSQNYKN